MTRQNLYFALLVVLTASRLVLQPLEAFPPEVAVPDLPRELVSLQPPAPESDATEPTATLIQPPATPPQQQTPPPPPPQLTQPVAQQQSPFQSLLMSRRDFRLARTPPMFGDFFGIGGQVLAYSASVAVADIPLAGGNRRAKVAENNMALPVDRVYFTYNHFHNALVADASDFFNPVVRDFSVNRYLFGIEKTFNDFQSSIELRVPLVNETAFVIPDFAVIGGSFGNLFLNYKQLLWSNDDAALATGLGLEIPTGSNVLGYSNDDSAYRVNNEAFNLSPYLGFLTAPNNGTGTFAHGFLQFDIPLNGNSVDVFPDFDPSQNFRAGTLNEQALMHIDLGIGYWLFQGRTDRLIEALAALFEVHYVQSLGSLDGILNSDGNGTLYDFGKTGVDAPYELLSTRHIVNLTFGLQAQLDSNLQLRFGTVFPVRDGQNRLFDAEIQASLIWYR